MHIAVITEYNPFHAGHKYQLSELRKAFPDACITVIMGGIFSQRGAPYITTPYVRAEAATLCGADLCLELPFPFSCAPARIFARAGVEIAEKIGADILAFGSECGDLEALKKMLDRLDSEEMKAALQKTDDKSISKMRAYSKAYEELYGEECSNMPNDILALEYMRAIKNGDCKISPYTIKRVGNYKGGDVGFASASELRAAYQSGGTYAMRENTPQAAFEVFKKADEKGLFGCDYEKLSSAVLLKFAKENTDVAFSDGGLYNHLQKIASVSDSIEELLCNATTSRYTHAEIMRCILYTLLNVKSTDLDRSVCYTKLLAANETGRAVLKQIRDIDVLTKPSAVDSLSDEAKEQYEKTFFAERAFALCFDGKYEHLKQTPKVR